MREHRLLSFLEGLSPRGFARGGRRASMHWWERLSLCAEDY